MVILLILALGFIIYDNKFSQNESINIKDVANMQSELNQYKQQEYEQKLKELELQSIHNREILNAEFKKVGKLLIYKGGVVFKDKLVQDELITKKELDLYLKYDYGVTIDLSNIEIKNVVGDTVIIHIPKSELKIEYVELNMDETNIKSDSNWLTKNYQPEDIEVILGIANDKVRNTLIENDQIFNDSYDSAKVEIEKLLMSVGFEYVIFE